jgi:hypothetical protein
MAEHVEQLGLFGAEPAPALPAPVVAPVVPPAPAHPVDDLAVAAFRLRELLSDGAWHPMDEVHRVVGLGAFYRVSMWGGSLRPPEPHQVSVALRGDGQGGCWYARWPPESHGAG